MSAAAYASFKVQAKEAIDFLKSKKAVGSGAWNELSAQAHVRSFAVSGAGADIAAEIHAALSKIQQMGGTLADFRRDFDSIVQKHGWTYNGKRGWRTALIYDQNMRASAMAGKWKKIQAGREQYPFLRYRAVMDGRTRQQHRAWNGLVYPVDHSFWNTHYPPNGFRCRCDVQQLSQSELDERSLKVSPQTEIISTERAGANGESLGKVPLGIDAGFDYNVGHEWLSTDLVTGENLAVVAKTAPDLAAVLSKKVFPSEYMPRVDTLWQDWIVNKGQGYKPSGNSFIFGQFDNRLIEGIAKYNEQAVLAGKRAIEYDSVALVVRDAKTDHLLAHLKDASKQISGADLATLPSAVSNYQVVLWDETNNALIFVPKSNIKDGKVNRIAVRLKQKRGKFVVNDVASFGRVAISTLQDTRQFSVISGGW